MVSSAERECPSEPQMVDRDASQAAPLSSPMRASAYGGSERQTDHAAAGRNEDDPGSRTTQLDTAKKRRLHRVYLRDTLSQMFAVKTLVIGVLIAGSFILQRTASADCCKFCGQGSLISESSRSDPSCVLYCAIVQCDGGLTSTTDCANGFYYCGTTHINDQCRTYVDCGG